jgi:hypothetical protein
MVLLHLQDDHSQPKNCCHPKQKLLSSRTQRGICGCSSSPQTCLPAQMERARGVHLAPQLRSPCLVRARSLATSNHQLPKKWTMTRSQLSFGSRRFVMIYVSRRRCWSEWTKQRIGRNVAVRNAPLSLLNKLSVILISLGILCPSV